ncbi:MAG: Uma2 family endonuclease, partial [Treponema sp.]|nr:Uma2 family endonuclease [Treponema sp.]
MAEAMKLQEGKAPVFRRKEVPAKGYTYKDYYSWGEDVRCELIDGIPYMMAAPTEWHQWVAGGIYRQLGAWLEGK